MYENDQRKTIDTFGDLDNTSEYGRKLRLATHAISKSKRNFQNRIPKELDKNFYITRISYNVLIHKNRP